MSDCTMLFERAPFELDFEDRTDEDRAARRAYELRIQHRKLLDHRRHLRSSRMQQAKAMIAARIAAGNLSLPDAPLGPSVLWIDRADAQRAYEHVVRNHPKRRSYAHWITGAGDIGSLMQKNRERFADFIFDVLMDEIEVRFSVARLGRLRRKMLVFGLEGASNESIGLGRWLTDESSGALLRAVSFDDIMLGAPMLPSLDACVPWVDRNGRRVLVVDGASYGARRTT